ncbi:hypothetical protein ATM97_32710 [Nocardia sp. MH4]|uniref:TetR-like C-terminal domain-containing protein n=1 Tax=Nocardia sp. MH4 TaxID=1768677 RepID=UPI001C4E7FDF|nr:TetR-like C-terminal domain-containing protein [Nocardia sp. MH4]MBW0274080.1 hypothetical protein [Nocardia sp. MH4]
MPHSRSPGGGVLRAVLSETHRRPALLAALRESLFDPRAAELRTLVRAAAAGEIRAEAVATPAATRGPELVMFRFLTEGSPVADIMITEIVDDVVLPLLTRIPTE